MRAIDGDALRDKLQNLGYDDWNQGVTTTWAEAFYACADIVAEAPTIEPEPHWIPCSERLPGKHGEMYLVTISDGAIYSAALQWDINRKRWYLSFLNNGEILIDYIDDVIAWQPLPEPYHEGKG